MTLLKVVQTLGAFDKESTIYAAKPWTENSAAIVMRAPESGAIPSETEKLRLKYFIEVSIAHDFIEEWAANLDIAPTSQQKCLRLIQYAINDA